MLNRAFERLEPRRLLAVTVAAGPVLNPANNHYYYRLTQSTWKDAQAKAITLGGHLVTINDLAENDFVFKTFSGAAIAAGGDLWIGLRDPVTGDGTGATHAANFKWISGDSATYRHWGPGEPNNDAGWGGEQYAVIVTQSHGIVNPKDWSDSNNDGSGRPCFGIVEVNPGPHIIALTDTPDPVPTSA